MVCILKSIHYYWQMFFEKFRKICLEIYQLDFAKFASPPGLVSQAVKQNWNWLTDINMLLIVEKGIREGIYNSIRGNAKANNKFIKNFDKKKESLYLKYWDVNNLCVQAMSQKLLVNGFE